MYIKFLDSFICTNISKIQWINDKPAFLKKQLDEFGDIRSRDGADIIQFSNNLFERTVPGQVLEIQSYKYNDETLTLDFKLNHRFKIYTLCVTDVDYTEWQIRGISKSDFEVMED